MKNEEKLQLLRLELLVMQRLQARNAVHMPDLIDKGSFENFNYIVMKLLGKSLQVQASASMKNGGLLECDTRFLRRLRRQAPTYIYHLVRPWDVQYSV